MILRQRCDPDFTNIWSPQRWVLRGVDDVTAPPDVEPYRPTVAHRCRRGAVTSSEPARLQQGHLRIGATPSAISPLVAPAIGALRQLHPDLAISLHDDIAEILAGMVADGTLDIAVAGRARTSPDVIQTEIASDAFGLACHRDHPLARQAGPIRLADIDPREVIHPSPNTGTARLLSDAPLPDSIKFGGLQTRSTIAQLCLVRASVGIAILPLNACGCPTSQRSAFCRSRVSSWSGSCIFCDRNARRPARASRPSCPSSMRRSRASGARRNRRGDRAQAASGAQTVPVLDRPRMRERRQTRNAPADAAGASWCPGSGWPAYSAG
ncbi:MAG: substrate-binding domain-containing protein [Pseudodonghicola sp.]